MSERPGLSPERREMEVDHLARLRRYQLGVTLALILAGNGILALTVWGTGVDLDRLIRFPDVFNPVTDICLRFGWHDVSGASEPVRLCNEWIQLADAGGETHKWQKDTHVVRGADGILYFDHGTRMGWPAFGLFAWVVTVIVAGLAVKRRLMARYRVRLGSAGKAS